MAHGAPSLGTAFGQENSLIQVCLAPGCSLVQQRCKGLAPSLTEDTVKDSLALELSMDWLSHLLRLHHNPAPPAAQSHTLHHAQVLTPTPLSVNSV